MELFRETIEVPLRYSTLFKSLEVKPRRGIFLYDTSRSGETLIEKAIVDKTEANFFRLIFQKL